MHIFKSSSTNNQRNDLPLSSIFLINLHILIRNQILYHYKEVLTISSLKSFTTIKRIC